MKGFDVLTPPQSAAAKRAIDEESAKRQHVVVYLSGAHAYGFPSPDSDLDLKAIHIERTDSLLGLSVPPPTYDRMEIIEGVEVDYTSNELGPALSGILHGNGNYIERILGETFVATTDFHAELRPLVKSSLSRRVHRHYRGFATSQKKALEASPTVKKVLYVLRTTLTGAHLLRTAELVTDVTRLFDRYGFGDAKELVVAKLRGENSPLEEAMRQRWEIELGKAFDLLDEAEKGSSLPMEAKNVGAIEAWLIRTRLGSL